MFFGLSIYIIFRLLGLTEKWEAFEWISLIGFRREIWFVNAYIVLYVFSPVLNLFAEKSSKRQFEIVLISFFILQLVFGFIKSEAYFSRGYSPLSFFGLYLLARYIKIYPNSITEKHKYHDITIYLCLSILVACMAFLVVKFSLCDVWLLYAYTSPFVIVSSLFFFLFFTKITIYARCINWIASSVFAVYLLHTDPLFFETYYLQPIREWYRVDNVFLFVAHITSLIVFVFVVSIIIDKTRIILYHFITRR